MTRTERAWREHVARRPQTFGPHRVCLRCDIVMGGDDAETCKFCRSAEFIARCIGPRLSGWHYGCVRCNHEGGTPLVVALPQGGVQ